MNKLQQIVKCFNQTFSKSERVILKSGADEPFYQAPMAEGSAIIFSREDYISSALHEVAHWCLAGESRRQIDDYGYWYHPDGRDQQQQAAFEQAEINPQALEWGFSLVCQHQFHFSVDNLSANAVQSSGFEKKVKQQLRLYIESGFPERAERFIQALCEVFERQNRVLVYQSFLKGCVSDRLSPLARIS